MDIIPPRRRGQLGAFSVGVGTQSGGFTVAAGAAPAAKAGTPAPPPPQSMSRQMATRAPGAPLRPGPSLSVSEQVEAERKALAKSTSAKASMQLIPQSSRGDTFQNNAVVAVQGYKPPAGTPEVTLPAKQPNENAAVTAAANQQPMTQGQVVQQVLARDAGILIPAKPGMPIAPPPGQPGSQTGMSILADLQPLSPAERKLLERITLPANRSDRRSRPIPPALPQWLRDWRRGIPASELEAQIKPIAADDGIVAIELRVFLRTANRPRPSSEPVPVGATSTPPALPQVVPPPPAPALSPAVAQTAATAAGAVVGAKVAIAQANGLAMMRSRIEAAKKALEEQKKIAEEAKKKAEEAAKAAAAKEKKAIIEADAVEKSQTATDGDKTEMEAKVRVAAEEKARAEKAAAAAAEEAARLAAEKAAAEKAAAETAKAAEDAKAVAEAKIEAANQKVAEAQVVEKKTAMERATMAKPTIELPDSALAPKNLVVLDQPKADEKAGMPGWAKAAAVVGGIAVLAYALRPKANLNGAPTLIDIDED